MKVVMNRCPKIEYGRLSSEIAWIGVNSRTLSSKRAQICGKGVQRMSLNGRACGAAAARKAARANQRSQRNKLTAQVDSTSAPAALDAVRLPRPINRSASQRAAPRTAIAMTDRTHSGLQHACHSCRRQARPDHRRARDADLPDHLVRVRRRRSRRLAVRPAGLRQHLYPHRQPDQRRAGRARRRARRRHRRACGRLRPRRAGHRDAHADDAGRRVRRVEEALWRLDQPVQPCLQEFRLERGVGRPRRHLRPSSARSSPKTKAIFIESIANPGGVITDIEAVANIARKAGVPLIVDNTLATPYLCKPIEYGADIVVHSLTKFLGGHGNSIGGMIVDGGTFNWSRDGPLSDAVASRGRNIPASCCTRPSAISPSRSPAACWACATSGRRCRRSTRS